MTSILMRLYFLLVSLLPSLVIAHSWKFIVYGDTRNNRPEHRQVLEAMTAYSPDYKFIINVGDVVDHGDVESEWQAWYHTTISVLGDLGQTQSPPKYMATPGNHDATETSAGLKYWNKYLPGQVEQFGNAGKFFTFDYENARFIILDSDKSSRSGKQYDMLMTAIQSNPKTWLFVITHKPIFSFGNYSYQDEIHDLWGVPLYQHGCDIIFNGHDHFYLRTKKIALDGTIHPQLDSLNGTTQIVTGNGGASIRNIYPNKDGNGYLVETYKKDYGYTELTVEGDSLHLRHILRDGSVFDEVFFRPNTKAVGVEDNERITPSEFWLAQNYPNPILADGLLAQNGIPTTFIRFSIPSTPSVTLKIFDVQGRIIRTIQFSNQRIREHQIELLCLDSHGHALPAGIYFYRIEAGAFVRTKKMILIR